MWIHKHIIQLNINALKKKYFKTTNNHYKSNRITYNKDHFYY